MLANRGREPVVVPSRRAIVLFDGVCGLCNWSIDFLLRHDRHGALRFAPLQSRAGQALLREHGLSPAEFSSVIVIDGSQVYCRSDAVLRALWRLGVFWRALAVLARVVPRSGRDAIYDWVARNRYRWFGQQSSCRIPTPDERQRFLPD